VVAAGVEVTGLLRAGRIHEQILAAATEQSADLIVLARHGQTRVARAWIGGVAQKVIGLADWPVLVSVFPHTKEPAA
jgi:nucleotide-binding universal stress UspA family protein